MLSGRLDSDERTPHCRVSSLTEQPQICFRRRQAGDGERRSLAMTPSGDRTPCKAHCITLTAYRLTMAMSDYVWRLRVLIGKQLLLMPSVSVLVQGDDDRLLLVRHADSGLWGLVGGAVEVDERPDEAAMRETQEETGLLVELTRLVTALGGPGFRVRYPNGDETAYVTIVYEARPVGGVERADGDEVLELGWFTHDDLRAIDLGAIALATLQELGWLLA
jgi:ADP-ribose pyrophosphatase YjhB (NUDIX family)